MDTPADGACHGSDRHVVELYREDEALLRSVARWLDALRAGGAAVAFCTEEHATGLREALALNGIDVARAEAEGRLVTRDADAALARFLDGRKIDNAAFKRLARATIATARQAVPHGRIRAWGEMVDILAQRGEPLLAHKLETLWNEVLAEEELDLLCTYRVDHLTTEAHGTLRDICATHLKLIVPHEPDALDRAVDRALAVVFGPAAAKITGILARTRVLPTDMPAGARLLMGLHDIHPASARLVLERARSFLAEPSLSEVSAFPAPT